MNVIEERLSENVFWYAPFQTWWGGASYEPFTVHHSSNAFETCHSVYGIGCTNPTFSL